MLCTSRSSKDYGQDSRHRCCSDSNVVHFLPLNELMCHVSKSCRYILVHAIADKFGYEKPNALVVFHTFTGYNTVSALSRKSKHRAWDIWKAFLLPKMHSLKWLVHRLFLERGRQLKLKDLLFSLVKQNGCMLRSQTRKQMFAKGNRLKHIPPIQATLDKHTKTAIYQGDHVWGKPLVARKTQLARALELETRALKILGLRMVQSSGPFRIM